MLGYFSAQMIERQRVALSKKYFSKVFCFSRVGRCWEAAGVRKSVRRRKSETTERRSPPFLHLISTFSPPWTDLRKGERHIFKWERAKAQKKKICANIGTLAVPLWKVEICEVRKSEEKTEEKGDNWETLSLLNWSSKRHKDTKGKQTQIQLKRGKKHKMELKICSNMETLEVPSWKVEI